MLGKTNIFPNTEFNSGNLNKTLNLLKSITPKVSKVDLFQDF